MIRGALIFVCFLALSGWLSADDSELRRRAILGAVLGPDEEEAGARLTRILPDSSAEAAGFEAGDLVLAIDGVEIADNAAFLSALAEKRAGEEARFEIVRDAEKLEISATLKEKPRETGDGYEVVYDSIVNGDFRQRTIITMPEGDGPFPAVLLLQGGHTCFPVDAPFGNPSGFVRLAQHLGKNGFVTMRIERPGCGDSEGGPLSGVDFETELRGNIEAVRALKKIEGVAENRVAIYGFSMGGIMAPLIATEEPVRAIAAYGTTCINWTEGVVAQRRRLLSLQGKTPAEINAILPGHIRFWSQLTIEKKSLREIDEAGAIPESIRDHWVNRGDVAPARPAEFFQQIADRNLAAAWENLAAADPPGPRVVVIRGEFDWHVTRAESTDWIVDSINRAQPGQAEAIVIPNNDHFNNRVVSEQESYDVLYGDRKQDARFDPAILEILRTWFEESLG